MRKFILLFFSILCLFACQTKSTQTNIDEKTYSDTIKFPSLRLKKRNN